MTLDSIAATPEALFTVSSVQYDATHKVAFERLRPCWMWNPARQSWRYKITAGFGLVPHDAPAQHAFSFAEGTVRQHNAFFEQAAEGQTS